MIVMVPVGVRLGMMIMIVMFVAVVMVRMFMPVIMMMMRVPVIVVMMLPMIMRMPVRIVTGLERR